MSALPVLCRASAASILLAAAVAAAEAPQAMDADFAKAVREWTTKPEFLSPLVDHLPQGGTVPSPKDVLGHHVGQPKTLTYTKDLYRYYRALAAKSPRVKVLDIGRTDEGRECLVVFVSSEAEHPRPRDAPRLPRPDSPIRAGSPRRDEATDPRHHEADLPPHGRPAQRRDRTAGDADGAGLPAGRRGLAARDQKIRDNVIVSLTPAAEPDGRDRYRRLVLPPPRRRDRRARELGRSRPTGASTSSTTTTATSTTRRSPCGTCSALVPEVAPADHARPARVGAVPLHLQRPGAAEPLARSHPLRRAAPLLELRDEPGREVRHAGDLDPRLRGHVVARLPGLHVLEPQRHGADVRDLRQRRGHHHEAQGGASRGRGRSRTHERHQARVVPALASLQGGRVVAAEQHELHGNRRAVRPRAHRELPADDPRELPQEEPELHRVGEDGGAATAS